MRWAKALLAALTLAAVAELLAARPSGLLLDYYVWITSLLGGAAASLDLAECWRRHGLYSTCLASLASLALIAVGRLGASALSWAYYDFLTPPVGTPYAPGAAALAALAVAGSISASATALMHAALGRPVAARGPTLADLLTGTARRLAVLVRPPYLYASAFLLGFVFKLIPELIWWPYPLGWDTVDYIAHLEDFLVKPIPFATFYWEGGLAHLPPLLDLVAAPLALAIGAWYTFKVLPPIMYGLSSAAAAFDFYLFDLAISWEFQREALGTLLLLAALGLMESRYEERPWASVALLILSALAHQETAYSAFAVGLVAGARSMLRGDARGAAAGLAASAASAALEIWYWGGISTPNPYTGVAPLGLSAYPNYLATAQGVLLYVAAGLGPGLALALVAMAERRPLYTSVALAAILLAGVSPAIAPYTSVVGWNLFLMQAGPLVAPLAGVALAEARNKAAAAFAFFLFFLLPALLYVVQPGYLAPLTTSLDLPYGMTPSPPYRLEQAELLNITRWFEGYNWTYPVLADSAVARFVHLAVRNPTPEQLIWPFGQVAPDVLCQVWDRLNYSSLVVATEYGDVLNSTLASCGRPGVAITLADYGAFGVYLVEATGQPSGILQAVSSK